MSIISRLLCLLLLLLLPACAAAIFGAAGTTVVAVAEKRTVGSALDDSVIWTKLQNHYYEDDSHFDRFNGLKVEVIEGRVHLNGKVKMAEDRIEAVRIAWQIDGVNEVTNDIKLEGEVQETFGSIAEDNWIGTRLRSLLLVEKDVSFIDYSIEVSDRIVYLMGIAENEEELNKVTKLASGIKGVKKVISYVRIKNERRFN